MKSQIAKELHEIASYNGAAWNRKSQRSCMKLQIAKELHEIASCNAAAWNRKSQRSCMKLQVATELHEIATPIFFQNFFRNNNLSIAGEEQNSLGGTRNLPECLKQNISKCMICSSKKKIFTKIFPFFLIGLVWSRKKGLHIFQVCPNIFKFAQICSRLPG